MTDRRVSSLFFFSSRRRHTRCSRDWSSDVCSSDLDERARHRESLLLAAREFTHPRGALLLEPDQAEHLLHGVRGPIKTAEQPYGLFDRELVGELRILQLNPQALAQGAGAREIGRASC